MKITCIVLSLSLTALSASAQIERKPVIIKTDSAQTATNDIQGDKQSRKERFRELNLTREQKGKMKEIGFWNLISFGVPFCYTKKGMIA